MSERVKIKGAKTKTFIDGLGHRGSDRLTEREMRLFMSIHDQWDQAMFGLFSLDQQLINQTPRFNSPGSLDSAEGTSLPLHPSSALLPCLLLSFTLPNETVTDW